MSDKTYLSTEEAMGITGRLLDEHDSEISISEKMFSIAAMLYNQLIHETDSTAYVLGTKENVDALESCSNETMSPAARECYATLFETACAIYNQW